MQSAIRQNNLFRQPNQAQRGRFAFVGSVTLPDGDVYTNDVGRQIYRPKIKPAQSIRISFRMLLTIAVLLVILLLAIAVGQLARFHAIDRSISTMQASVVKAEADLQEEQQKFAQTYNERRITELAQKELGMQRASEAEVILISVPPTGQPLAVQSANMR